MIDNVLETDYEFDASNPLKEYPRPQFKRDSYFSLNGEWYYKIFNDNNLFINYKDTIIVPYPIESSLSGVCKRIENGDKIGYKKEFFIPDGFIKDRVILHFEAVDQVCDVYFNRNFMLHHEGGYTPFEIEITDYLKQKNEIVLIATDTLDKNYSYGKQKKKSGGIWHTPISGIWQSVWLESVNYEYIKTIKITPNIDTKSVKIDFSIDSFEIEPLKVISVYYNNEFVKKISTENDSVEIKFTKIKLWTPDEPNLYDIKIEMKEDVVYSYFGMRKFSIETLNHKKILCLNNKPFFFHGLLDQGYYPDGLYTPKNYEIFFNEITQAKKLGFNTLRKYMKVESRIWYSLCDKLGMIVWQDFVNGGKYSFFKDNCLPIFGFKKKRFFTSKRYLDHNKNFINHMNEVVDKLYNSPSIALWTIFNEGKGQFDIVKMTTKLKLLDNTRLIDSASGWFYKENENQLESLHIYNKKINISNYNPMRKPIIISEFGGYSYRVNNHIFDSNKEYGYKKFDNKEEYNNELLNVYVNEIITAISYGLQASIYTQLTDVEEETNGLLTYDRKVCKIDESIAQEISSKINKAYKEYNYGK